jgi:2-methylfumaryl-CoA isomerase
MFRSVEHPAGTYLTPGSPVTASGESRGAPARAPKLGEHTEEVLSSVLNLSGAEIAKLHDQKLVASSR